MAAPTVGGYLIHHPKTPELATWSCHPHEHHFLHCSLALIPHGFHRKLGRKYSKLYNKGNRRDANLSILELWEQAKESPIALTLSEDEVDELAKREARRCRRIAATQGAQMAALSRLHDYLLSKKLPLPKAKTPVGFINRTRDEQWWRRTLRPLLSRHVERLALTANLVNRFDGIYASDVSVITHAGRRFRNQALLSMVTAINELGQEFTLADLSASSVANPRIRRSELMARIAGTEQIAKDFGHHAIFYTITCPSKMHAAHSRTGAKNEKYGGITPRESQNYLNKLWQRIRAALKRAGILYYGIRVAEPQHDGTPHWHLLIFMPDHDAGTITATLRHYAFQEDGDEPGADKHRFTAEPIDWAKGTAVGYVAKYISKNIDGFGLENDLYGQPAASSAERVQAWASIWGIRQFQFFGAPPVTVWRELRRLAPSQHNDVIGEAANAADSGDWAAFVRLMGGPAAVREAQTISIFRVTKGGLNLYGEPKAAQTIGVRQANEFAITRVHKWTISVNQPDSATATKAKCLSEKMTAPQAGGREPFREGLPPDEASIGLGHRTHSPLEFCQ